jgi:PAS domain S-box-containing protein
MAIDKDKSVLSAATKLRLLAEERWRTKTAELHPPGTEEATRRHVHELEVHQIELEMQNVELCKARDEVETALENYADLYDFAPVGYVTLDHDGVIRAANLTSADLLGVERSRLIGRSFGQIVKEEYRPTFAAFLGTVLTSQGKKACEVELQKGGKHQLFVQIEAVVAASGQECHVAIVDISVHRRLVEKLEILHTDLAARAAELEASNQKLEAFNYTVAHDLHSPLLWIGGYSRAILKHNGDRLDVQYQEYLRKIFEGVERMERLIEVLLNFSRPTGETLHREPVELGEIVNTIVAELEQTDPARQVIFRITEGVIVNGDRHLLRVILLNLLGNAWKYTCKQQQAIIEFGVIDCGGPPTCFVRDNGSGFDMKFAERLFLPFQRLPGIDVEGHGIGLATVERIVRHHGGRIWAESEPGKGATFLFTLEQIPII